MHPKLARNCALTLAAALLAAGATARADSLSIGPIERNDVGLHVADHEDLNVLGMNYLSSLERWGVEGRWLILQG